MKPSSINPMLGLGLQGAPVVSFPKRRSIISVSAGVSWIALPTSSSRPGKHSHFLGRFPFLVLRVVPSRCTKNCQMSSSLHLEVDFMMRGAKVFDDDNCNGDGGGGCVIAITGVKEAGWCRYIGK